MIDLLPIDYVSDPDNRIPDALRPYFQQQGFNLAPYRPEQGPGAVFLVFSPLWNGQHYLSVEGVWARYLAKNFPHTKMIVAGSTQSDDPNYVDVLNMPEDWSVFLEQTPQALRFHADCPVFTGGINMVKRLARFLIGHGNESMADACGSLKYKLDLLAKPLERDENGTITQKIIQIVRDDATQKRWRTVRTRWSNYSLLFQFLPFSETFETIGFLVDDLSLVFEDTHVEDIKMWLPKAISSLSNLQAQLNHLYNYVEEQT